MKRKVFLSLLLVFFLMTVIFSGCGQKSSKLISANSVKTTSKPIVTQVAVYTVKPKDTSTVKSNVTPVATSTVKAAIKPSATPTIKPTTKPIITPIVKSKPTPTTPSIVTTPAPTPIPATPASTPVALAATPTTPVPTPTLKATPTPIPKVNLGPKKAQLTSRMNTLISALKSRNIELSDKLDDLLSRGLARSSMANVVRQEANDNHATINYLNSLIINVQNSTTLEELESLEKQIP